MPSIVVTDETIRTPIAPTNTAFLRSPASTVRRRGTCQDIRVLGMRSTSFASRPALPMPALRNLLPLCEDRNQCIRKASPEGVRLLPRHEESFTLPNQRLILVITFSR